MHALREARRPQPRVGPVLGAPSEADRMRRTPQGADRTTTAAPSRPHSGSAERSEADRMGPTPQGVDRRATPLPRVGPILFPATPHGVTACGIRLSVMRLAPGCTRPFQQIPSRRPAQPPSSRASGCVVSAPVRPVSRPLLVEDLVGVGTFLSTSRACEPRWGEGVNCLTRDEGMRVAPMRWW